MVNWEKLRDVPLCSEVMRLLSSITGRAPLTGKLYNVFQGGRS